MRTIVFLIIGLLAIIAIAVSEHADPNAGLPLIQLAAVDQPKMLFAPCPLARRNFPQYQERKA